MPDKTLTTEAKIRRIQQLMSQHQPTSKLYQSMAPQLQTLIAQLKVERQEAERKRAHEVERQKAEAEEKKRLAEMAAEKAKVKAQAAAKEAARQAQIAAQKAEEIASADADSQPAVAAHTEGEPSPQQSASRLYYHARGCFKATYTDGKLLWRGHQLECSGPPWLAKKADIPLYFRVYPAPRKVEDDYTLSKFWVYAWNEHKPEDCEDGQFYLGGCWIYKSQVAAAAQRPLFRVYRNRRKSTRDKGWPLNLKLQWPEQEPLRLIRKDKPGWREQYNFYQIKAAYDPEQASLVFTELLSGPFKMPFALHYHSKRKKKKKQREEVPTDAAEERVISDKSPDLISV